MCPFRKRLELRGVSDGPVFIDLGSYPLPDADRKRRIHLVRVSDDDDLQVLTGLFQADDPVIVDLSAHPGDRDILYDRISDIIPSSGFTLTKVNQDIWIISPDGPVTEYPGKD